MIPKKITNIEVDMDGTKDLNNALFKSLVFKELRNTDWIMLNDSGVTDDSVLNWVDWRNGLKNLLNSNFSSEKKVIQFNSYLDNKPKIIYGKEFNLNRHKIINDKNQMNKHIFEVMQNTGLDYGFMIDFSKSVEDIKIDLIKYVNIVFFYKILFHNIQNGKSIFDMFLSDHNKLLKTDFDTLIKVIETALDKPQLKHIHLEINKNKWTSI